MVKLYCECEYCKCLVGTEEDDSRTTDEQFDACHEKMKRICEETLNNLQMAASKED